MTEEFPYGSVVWAKMPSFPWWPAKVIEPQAAHLSQLGVKKLRKTQYVVVFYNDNEQIGLIANFNMQSFRNRLLHEGARREKGSMKSKLLKAIEFAEDDLVDQEVDANAEDPPAKDMKSRVGDSPGSTATKRSPALNSYISRVISEKNNGLHSPVLTRKNSASLGKRKSSNQKRPKPDPMEDFIAEEGDVVDGETSDIDDGHEIMLDASDKADRRHKKPKHEHHLSRDFAPEKRHRSRSKSERHISRTEYVKPSQRLDFKRNEVHSIRSNAKNHDTPRETADSFVALPSSRPPSLSEEAYKSMMRDTENVEELSNRARFQLLMEHLRAIRASNVKQWKEGLKNANTSEIICKESELLKAIIPALLSGRKLVRWVAKGNRKTSETAGQFDELEKDAIAKALAVQKVYFELGLEDLTAAGSKLREVQKNLADISRAASRCFRDILILWNDIHAPGSLKECMHDGIHFMENNIPMDETDYAMRTKDELRGDNEANRNSHDSVGAPSSGDSFTSDSRKTEEKQENGTHEEKNNQDEEHRKKRNCEASDGEMDTRRATDDVSEDSPINLCAPGPTKEVEKSHAEPGKKKDRWKGFSRDKFIQVVKDQLRPLAEVTSESEQLEVIELLERRLSAAFDPCTNGYYKTGLRMTHGIQKLVKRYKLSKTDEMHSDEESGGLELLMNAMKHPEDASKLVDFVLM